MSYISHIDLSRYEPPPDKPGNPLWQLGQQAKSAACSLWEQYPKRFVGDNPVSSPIRHAWNALCQDPPTNQPPTLPSPPPFSGGQCNFRYQLFVRFNRVDLVGAPPSQQCVPSQDPLGQYPLDPYAGRGYFWGKIGGVRLAVFDSTNCGGFLAMEVLCHGVGSNPRLAVQQWVRVNLLPGGVGSSGRLTSIAAIQVKPYPGEPADTCGNLPPDYPDNPPPPGDLNFTFNLNEGDSNTNLDFIYKPTFNLPITFQGDDVDITFDFGGINFDWHGNKEKPGGDKNFFPTLPPVIRLPGGRGGGGGGSNPQPTSPGVDKKPSEELPPNGELEEEETLEEEIVWVEIEVLSIWENSKFFIENVNPDNNVYFAGYLSWQSASQTGLADTTAELPIRRKRTLMRKPEQFTGYKVRATNGAVLSVTSYTQKKTIEKEGG